GNTNLKNVVARRFAPLSSAQLTHQALSPVFIDHLYLQEYWKSKANQQLRALFTALELLAKEQCPMMMENKSIHPDALDSILDKISQLLEFMITYCNPFEFGWGAYSHFNAPDTPMERFTIMACQGAWLRQYKKFISKPDLSSWLGL
ncbi:hypothetical protein FRC16_004771, partial [Serendipita sp. 398]